MRFIVPLALAASLSACATVEKAVPVPYAAAPAQPVAGAANIRVTVTTADARTTNRGRISTMRNGYGMEMAAIRAEEPVESTVKRALSDELKARGYVLADGGPTVNAAVTTFYNDYKNEFVQWKAQGRVDLKVSVTGPGGQALYTRDISGAADKGVQLSGATNAAKTLSAALSNALATLFQDPAFTAALAGRAGAGA